MDGSVVFARWRQCAPHIQKAKKMVAMTASLKTSKSAMSYVKYLWPLAAVFAQLTSVTDRQTSSSSAKVMWNHETCSVNRTDLSWQTDRQTDRATDHSTPSVTEGRICVVAYYAVGATWRIRLNRPCDAGMQPNNNLTSAVIPCRNKIISKNFSVLF